MLKPAYPISIPDSLRGNIGIRKTHFSILSML